MVKSWVLRKSLIFSMIIGFATVAFGNDIADLEALEAELAEETNETSAADPSVLFTGNFKILVSRPIYAPYSEEKETKWISAVSEPFFRFKISALPKTYIYSQKQIDAVVRNYRDFSRRVSKQNYIDGAKELGATHALYMEYEPQGRNQIRFQTELINVATNAVTAGASEVFEISNLEDGLMKTLDPVAKEIHYDVKDIPTYSSTFLGNDQKLLQNIGNAIVKEGSFEQVTSENIFNDINGLAAKNSQLPVARYTAAAVASRAEKHSQATAHLSALISRSSGHSALYLSLARYHRRAQSYSDALNALKHVENIEGLKIQAAIERANVLLAMDRFAEAKQYYDVVLKSGEANAEIFFRLALVSIQLRQLDDVTNYLKQAKSEKVNLNYNHHFRLGEAYAEQGMDDKALEHLDRSVELQQKNPNAWSMKAKIYLRQNKHSDAAQCYVNLFHIDNNLYRNNLRTAGELYEKAGDTEAAKDAYSLFLARRFNDPVVSLRLSTIYFNENKCKKATELLEGIDTLPAIKAEATKIMDHCLGENRGRREIVPGSTLGQRRLSPFRVVLVITTGVAAAGSFTGGFLADKSLEDLGEQYSNAQIQSEVVDFRGQIESRKKIRNILYGAAGACLGLFTINIAIPSRK